MLSASIAKAPMSVGAGLATKEMASAAFVSWNNFPFMNDRGKALILYWPWKKYTLKVYSKKLILALSNDIIFFLWILCDVSVT